jgi:hypothetical protein
MTSVQRISSGSPWEALIEPTMLVEIEPSAYRENM